MLRSIFGSLSLVLLTSFATVRGASAPETKGIASLGWLAGSWQTSRKDGASVEENWTRPLGGTMLATGRQVEHGETVFFEFLRIEERKDGALVYVALPLGKGSTDFTLTKQGERDLMFENPAHDSPKRIAYRLEKDELVARVDDGPEDKQGIEVRYQRAK
jgi:hypothetical protein